MSPSHSNNDPGNPSAFYLTHRALLGLLLGSFALAFLPVWKRLIEAYFSSGDHSHGLFIIPICAYLVWQKREILKRTPIKGSLFGLPLVIFSLLVYVFSHYAEILTLSSLSMVMAIGSALLFTLGRKMLKLLVFPLFLLLFMIPVPAQIHSSLTIPLQLMVSEGSAWVSSLIGLSVYREGNMIHLPGRSLEVVQACSGLRSMASLLTLSVVYGYLTFRSNVLRALLFASGIVVAIFVNVVRVLVIVMAFSYLEFDLTTETAHTVIGVAIFPFAILLVAIIRGVLSPWEQPTEKA
jgi:exosortase